VVRGFLARTRVAAKRLLRERDIFLAAARGDEAAVDDIFNGLITGVKCSTTDVNENQETLLSVCARCGHLGLVHKCVQWGFELNHTSMSGETPIVASVKAGHEKVTNYLSAKKEVDLNRDGLLFEAARKGFEEVCASV
jgi:hypothetical protein